MSWSPSTSASACLGVLLRISAELPRIRRIPNLWNTCLDCSTASLPVWLANCLASLVMRAAAWLKFGGQRRTRKKLDLIRSLDIFLLPQENPFHKGDQLPLSITRSCVTVSASTQSNREEFQHHQLAAEFKDATPLPVGTFFKAFEHCLESGYENINSQTQ